MNRYFQVFYKGVLIDVAFEVPRGQEHRAEEEWNKLEETIENFYQMTESEKC